MNLRLCAVALSHVVVLDYVLYWLRSWHAHERGWLVRRGARTWTKHAFLWYVPVSALVLG